MKIVALNPSSELTKNVIRDVLYGCWCKGKRIGGASLPPYSLLCLTSFLIDEKLNVELIDAQAENMSWNTIVDRTRTADAVIISTSTMTINEDALLLAKIKSHKPDMLTLAFGSHPTFLPQDTLSKGSIDICVRHEPEFIIRDVLKSYFKMKDKAWQDVKGISFIDQTTGKFVSNDSYPPIHPLDQLPFLKTQLLPKDIDYFNPIVKNTPYITTVTSRGCPAKCTFCTVPQFYGKKIRVRSEQGVVNEMKYFWDRGFREVYFRDETFTFSKKRTLKICQLIRENGLEKMSWICNARVGTVDKEVLTEMKAAGCHFIKFGIESSNQDILNKVKKGTKVKDIVQTFKWLNELGIESHAHCMIGIPGDTIQTVRQTIDFVCKLNPTSATWTITTPYPGSELYDFVKEKFPAIGDGSDTDLSSLHTVGIYNMLYADVPLDEIEYMIKRAVRTFYLRPSYWFKTLARIKNYNDFKRFAIAGFNVLSFSVSGD